jgi:anti-sigma28 factor (negative regulator of flagellin synthesis)
MRPGRHVEAPSQFELDRLGRVIEIRQAILDGTYDVSALDVADAMISARA